MATPSLPSRDPHRGGKSIWLHQPCLLGIPIVGRNQYGYITPVYTPATVRSTEPDPSTKLQSKANFKFSKTLKFLEFVVNPSSGS